MIGFASELLVNESGRLDYITYKILLDLKLQNISRTSSPTNLLFKTNIFDASYMYVRGKYYLIFFESLNM